MVRCRRALPLLLVAAAAAVVKASAAAPQAALERPRTIGTGQRVPYQAWSEPIKAGVCRKVALANAAGVITCTVTAGNIKSYQFPAGVFEISEQLLVPPNVSITGNAGPNDLHRPTKSPDWQTQTLFLATRGSTDYKKNYCHAQDMVTTRVGFVLSSFVAVRNVSYQGIDTIRPDDNGGLCGGGAFETKGCAENNCKNSNVNNAGSDGMGSTHVTIDNVRLNDYYAEEDESKVGAVVPGNYACKLPQGPHDPDCCFCKPNAIRATQVGVWVPQTRNPEGTQNLLVNNVVSSATQADAINLHGYVRDAVVQNCHFKNTGDDGYVLWGADLEPENVTFRDSTIINTGILRPNWYGVCIATYGVKSVVFQNITCRSPTLEHPIPPPRSNGTWNKGCARIDGAMAIIYTSFGGKYPQGNSITIADWSFEDLSGRAYTPEAGSLNTPAPQKMVWTKSDDGADAMLAPFYVNGERAKVNVHAVMPSGISVDKMAS